MISVSLSTGVYCPWLAKVRVGQDHGAVRLTINAKTIELTTPAAHKLGYSLVTKGGLAQKGEHVTLSINGETMQLLQEHALQLGGAILRKTDDADDYQLARYRK
jgi:hypothetical protein